MSTIRRRAFAKVMDREGPCSNNLKMQAEKKQVLSDIILLSSNGLSTPKANAKLAKISTELLNCEFCDGNCGCGK